MKKNRFILLLIIALVLPLNVGATKNPYKKNSSFGPNCTWHAWQHAHDKAGVTLPGWGNASTWYDSAKKAGFSVGKTPKANSIAVWNWYAEGKNYGHVAYVQFVRNGEIYIWESGPGCADPEDKTYQECMANGVSEESDRQCYQNAPKIGCPRDATYYNTPGDLVGYIYLSSKPKKTTTKKATTTTKKTTTTTTTSTTTKIISSNNNLASLSIDEEEINLDKNTLSYDYTVDNQTTIINISARAEDVNAKIEGIGEQKLEVGKNIFHIVVKAEDEKEKTYVLNIHREETTTSTTKIKETKQKEKKNSYYIYYIVVAIGIIVLAIIIVVISKHKKN